MVFRKGGILSRREKWVYNVAEIEIVNQFNYLGIIFTPGGSFIHETKTLSGKVLRVLCSLISMTKHLDIPLNMRNLFDSYVCSILSCASEIWGLTSAMRVDRVQRKFCKWTLNLKQSANNLAVCSELEIYPLIVERKTRIVKYWLKLISILTLLAYIGNG